MIVDNRFSLCEQIGQGSSGTVYSAVDINKNTKCAVKIVTISFL